MHAHGGSADPGKAPLEARRCPPGGLAAIEQRLIG
jgi:hypothetical protein